MSLTKEIAHDLRLVNNRPGESAVLPSWAKILPIAFYAGVIFFTGGMTYNTIRSNLYKAKIKALQDVVGQYKQLLAQDKVTTRKLISQQAAAVRVARWVDYSPIVQRILVHIFQSFNEQVSVNDLYIERKDGSTQPEYNITLSFKAPQEEVNGVIKRMRDNLNKEGWQLTTGSQIYQDSVTKFQGYIQPILSVMPLESQYLSIPQEVQIRANTPEAQTSATSAAPAAIGQ
jgi:hypothetical protein